jgi:type III restriction enzyme
VLEGAARRLSETPGFPWSRPTLAAARCVFNLVPCDNSFERAFAALLDAAPEVTAFGKLPEAVRFSIPYTDSALNLRYYEPDFVAVLDDGRHFLLETKGREDLDVAHKDRAATLWCEHASALTDTPWAYKKVKQTEFEALRPDRFEDLLYLG